MLDKTIFPTNQCGVVTKWGHRQRAYSLSSWHIDRIYNPCCRVRITKVTVGGDACYVSYRCSLPICFTGDSVSHFTKSSNYFMIINLYHLAYSWSLLQDFGCSKRKTTNGSTHLRLVSSFKICSTNILRRIGSVLQTITASFWIRSKKIDKIAFYLWCVESVSISHRNSIFSSLLGSVAASILLECWEESQNWLTSLLNIPSCRENSGIWTHIRLTKPLGRRRASWTISINSEENCTRLTTATLIHRCVLASNSKHNNCSSFGRIWKNLNSSLKTDFSFTLTRWHPKLAATTW